MSNKDIIVYVDGVFDLFHSGHIEFLKKAKSLGSYLIAGVISDENCQSYKRKPIIELDNRLIMIENTKIVDKVIDPKTGTYKVYRSDYKIFFWFKIK